MDLLLKSYKTNLFTSLNFWFLICIMKELDKVGLLQFLLKEHLVNLHGI